MNARTNHPIGIFDSGLGGLTVMREIEKMLPGENLIYFGDTARVPYGSKSKDAILRFSTENILFLLRKKVKLVVIACNTSSSLALDYLKRIFSIPIIGVIDAGVEKALRVSGGKRIGIIGTKSTIASKSYQRKLMRRDKHVVLYAQACPLFVPLVEEGLLKGSIVDSIVALYLNELKDKIDTLILGCTHYPLLKKTISGHLRDVCLVDSAREVAHQTRLLLQQNGLLNPHRKALKKDFYVTDEPREFLKVARIFLKRDIKAPAVVNV